MGNKIISFKSPSLILAGIGALDRMGEEARNLDAKTALIVTDKGVIEAGICQKVEAVLREEGMEIDVFDGVIPDPDIDCAEACIAMAKGKSYELIVGVGGGSPMDIAAIASVMCTNPGTVHEYLGINLVKNPGIPTFLIPTTAGTGAEVTPNAILTDVKEQLKKAVVSPYILPRVAVVDPLLTISMPPRVTAFSGMDALTHAIESYTSVNATALTDMFAEEAITLIGQNLRTAVFKGENLGARDNMLLGSLYAGISLANAGVTAVHALAYPLGGEFNVPHGIANGLLLPYIMEANVMGDIPKFARVATLMGERVAHLPLLEQAYHAAEAVKSLYKDLPVPQSLSELNIPREVIPKMAEGSLKITRLMANNPVNLTVKDAERVYENAY